MAIDTPRDRWRYVQCAHDALACCLDLALSRSQTKPPEFIGATFSSRFFRLFATFERTLGFIHQPRYDASKRWRGNRGQQRDDEQISERTPECQAGVRM
jgi:hypothetical protein